MRKLFRNKFTYIVAMTLVCAMSLAACGNKNAKAETESKKAVQDATESTKKAEKQKRLHFQMVHIQQSLLQTAQCFM